VNLASVVDPRLECRATLFFLPFVPFRAIRDDPRHSTLPSAGPGSVVCAFRKVKLKNQHCFIAVRLQYTYTIFILNIFFIYLDTSNISFIIFIYYLKMIKRLIVYHN